MMNHFFLIKEFIAYKFNASSAHGIHSPFVFDFIKTVLEDDRHFYAFDEIGDLRKKLYADNTVLQVEDFGAGSLLSNFKQRVVKDIAKTAGRNEKFGKLLFRIVDKYQFSTIIELGTSLGIGTSYLAKANASAQITTLEGSKEIAATAGKNFNWMQLKNIVQVVGNFDNTFADVLQTSKQFDLLFIDGNHRKEPTINYFNQALAHIHDDSMIIFDDIHWSEGMREAWDTIRTHESVLLSIDLFYFGIVLFKKEFKVKQHFILNY